MKRIYSARPAIRSIENEKQSLPYGYLLFWPALLLRYLLLERYVPRGGFTPIWMPLDDRIPFCEWFVIPYLMWHAAIVGMHLYTMMYDREAFRKYSNYLIFTMTVSTAVFLLFPSCQNLRPEVFPRDNLLTRLVGAIYALDTNTNVFPSEHVIGACALAAAAWNTKTLHTPLRLTAIWLLALLICCATVFLKQHSVLDVVGAVPVCVVGYLVVYGRKEGKDGSSV